MKKIINLLLLTAIMQQVIGQTETFDIATYNPPKGWKRSTGQGYVIFQNGKQTGSAGSFCILAVYASRQGSGDADKDFKMEWTDLVEKPNSITVTPETQKEQTPEGWTAVSGTTKLKEGQFEYICMLVSASGYGKVMSVLIKVAGQDYVEDIDNFLSTMQLDTTAWANNNTNSQSANTNAGQSIIGTWSNGSSVIGNYVTPSGAFVGSADVHTMEEYEFKPDNTYIYKFFGSTSGKIYYTETTGTFKIDGRNLTLTPVKRKGGYSGNIQDEKNLLGTPETFDCYIGPNKWEAGPFLNLHKDGNYYMWSDYPYNYFNRLK